MSLCICLIHSCQFDSDFHSMCPLCEGESTEEEDPDELNRLIDALKVPNVQKPDLPPVP